jgi:SAM-dependent methyltransferase
MLTRTSNAYGKCITYIAEKTGAIGRDYELEDGGRCYGFIPYHSYYEVIHELVTVLRLVERSRGIAHTYSSKPKFLDIGCGIGNMVLLAQMFGYAADGLEYNPKICRAAKQFCAHTPAKIFRGDMRTFDRYGDYDVLYYYQPMCDYAVMAEFTRELAKNVKPGAYVVCHGNAEGFRESKEFRLTGSSMWRKRGKLI